MTVYQQDGFAQAQTPGSRDVLVFERTAEAGRKGRAGSSTLVFDCERPCDIRKAVKAVQTAGGRVLSQGEFVPGRTVLFFKDPDGYEVEISVRSPRPCDPT